MKHRPVEKAFMYLHDCYETIADDFSELFPKFRLFIFVVVLVYGIYVLQRNINHFARLSAVLGALILLAKRSGWDFLLFEDINPLALIVFAFSGRSFSNLTRKFKEQRIRGNISRDVEHVEREIQWSFAFLALGAILHAIAREKREIPNDMLRDANDNNACANFGGCLAGSEHLPENTFSSVLFGTRFFSEMSVSGARWNPNNFEHMDRKCNYKDLTIPMIVKSRYRVPLKKVWKFNSIAIKIKCLNYEINNPRDGVTDVQIFHVGNDTSKMRVQIEKNYMDFSLCFEEVVVTESYLNIKMKHKPFSNCKENNRTFVTCNDTNLRTAIKSAMELKYFGKNKISYWKIMTACILHEFNEPDEININNIKIYRKVDVYLNHWGNRLSTILLIFSIIFICIDELDELETAIRFIEQMWDILLNYLERDQGKSIPEIVPQYNEI